MQKSVATINATVKADIVAKLSSPGPDFSQLDPTQEAEQQSIPPNSSTPSVIVDGVEHGFPQLPSHLIAGPMKCFTKLGTKDFPVNLTQFSWKPLLSPSVSSSPPAWFTTLMDVMDCLLLLLWVRSGEMKQPHETKEVQPVLFLVLAIAGCSFALLPHHANGIKMAVQGGIFPLGTTFVGSTAMILKFLESCLCMVEVKVVFDVRKYFLQAVAQAYSAAVLSPCSTWTTCFKRKVSSYLA